MNHLDWRRIALREAVNARKAARIAAGGYQDQKCPYTGCSGMINVSKQILYTGGGAFVCPTCGNRSSVDEKTGQLTPLESFAATCAAACDTTRKT